MRRVPVTEGSTSAGDATAASTSLLPITSRAHPPMRAASRPPSSARMAVVAPPSRSVTTSTAPLSTARPTASTSAARLEAALLEAGACRAVWKLTNAEIFVASMAWGT